MKLTPEEAYRQAARVLPQRFRREAYLLPIEDQRRAEEFRLRTGRPMAVVLPEGERSCGGTPVTGQDLELLLEIASRNSLHTVLDQLCGGYLTAEGGHRVGLCGAAVLRNGAVCNLRPLSSAAVRIARQIPGAAAGIWPELFRTGRLENTLILAPPGAGKTTLLRDVIRRLSQGEGCSPMRVSLADERGEVAALYNGCPQLDVGGRTDILSHCPKAEGMMLLLRAMAPQVLAADEITAPEDIRALQWAAGCGVTLLATAHGADRADLSRRPLYRSLLEAKLFRTLAVIRREGDRRIYQEEELS